MKSRHITTTLISAMLIGSVASAAPTAKTPTDMIGSWSWTTISGVSYENTTTHQLASPSGMSARFTFTNDGHYKYFFYVRQRTYSFVSESSTTETGTVTFSPDGSFTMQPTQGHYNGHMGSHLIDRDMSKEERQPKKYHWEWRTENGKRQLYIGPDASSLSPFKSVS